MRTDLVVDALDMAARNYDLADECIFHSDRGTQYMSDQFAKHATALCIRRSVGRTGICYDNALAESFNAALKVERVNRTQYPTLEHARRDIVQYIEFRYNRRRLHSALGYRTPREAYNGSSTSADLFPRRMKPTNLPKFAQPRLSPRARALRHLMALRTVCRRHELPKYTRPSRTPSPRRMVIRPPTALRRRDSQASRCNFRGLLDKVGHVNRNVCNTDPTARRAHPHRTHPDRAARLPPIHTTVPLTIA